MGDVITFPAPGKQGPPWHPARGTLDEFIEWSREVRRMMLHDGASIYEADQTVVRAMELHRRAAHGHNDSSRRRERK